MTELRRCSRCVIPETHETIVFDDEGICNICRQQDYKQEKIDWKAKKIDLDELIETYRGKGDYDCIVPFSGGKDSTWTLYYLVKEYGIKPLVVRFDHGFLRPTVLKTHETRFGSSALIFTISRRTGKSCRNSCCRVSWKRAISAGTATPAYSPIPCGSPFAMRSL